MAAQSLCKEIPRGVNQSSQQKPGIEIGLCQDRPDGTQLRKALETADATGGIKPFSCKDALSFREREE